MKISNNFYLKEFVKSDTASANRIYNTPDCDATCNIVALVVAVMQPLSNYMKCPIVITSGYRNKELNKLVGGSPNSHHITGMACDFKCKDNAKAFNFIKDNLDFDELVWEKGTDKQPAWIHITYNRLKNRKLVKRIK